MVKKGATALPDSTTFHELWDAIGSKLIESTQGQLPSKQRVVGSNPARDATHSRGATALPQKCTECSAKL